jgi:hypothetical protein
VRYLYSIKRSIPSSARVLVMILTMNNNNNNINNNNNNFKRKREREAMASLIIPRDEDLISNSPGSNSSNKFCSPGIRPRIYETPKVGEDILSLKALSESHTAAGAAEFILKEQSWNWVCNSNPFRARKQSRFCHTSLAIDVDQKKAEYFADGFVVFDSFNPMLDSLVESIVKGIYKLRVKGFPPTFFLLFDECWEIIQMFSNMLKNVTDNKYCNFDILAWVIDAAEGSGAGFSPHRDRQPNDVASSFHANHFPKYCTCWIALTEATPENSCLYMIPKWADPGYSIVEGDDTDPLREALKDKHDYQNIRAVPLSEGNSVVFSHRILHWGSRASRTKVPPPPPRVSMAFAMSDDSFERPYLDPSVLPLPPFALRAALACAQMIIYYQRFQCDAKQLLIFKTCFELQSHHFDGEYAKKVRFEFANAVMELEKRDKVPAPESSSTIDMKEYNGSKYLNSDKVGSGIDDEVNGGGKAVVDHKRKSEDKNGTCGEAENGHKHKKAKSTRRRGIAETNSNPEDGEDDDDEEEGNVGGLGDIVGVGLEAEDAVEAALEAMLDNQDDFCDDYEDDGSMGDEDDEDWNEDEEAEDGDDITEDVEDN